MESHLVLCVPSFLLENWLFFFFFWSSLVDCRLKSVRRLRESILLPQLQPHPTYFHEEVYSPWWPVLKERTFNNSGRGKTHNWKKKTWTSLFWPITSSGSQLELHSNRPIPCDSRSLVCLLKYVKFLFFHLKHFLFLLLCSFPIHKLIFSFPLFLDPFSHFFSPILHNVAARWKKRAK